MKKLEMKKMEKIEGGVSNRGCLILGAATLVFVLTLEWAWAVGTVAGAAGAGCFDQ